MRRAHILAAKALRRLVRWGFPFERLVGAKAPWAAKLKLWLDCQAINLVIDVGAHKGEYARYLRAIGFRGRIVSFEPNPESFDLLQEAMASDDQWRGHQCALGDQAGHMKLRVNASSDLSSFLPARGDELAERLGWRADAVTSEVSVPVRRLEDVFEDLTQEGLVPRVFLKLDTQGFDLAVWRGARSLESFLLGVQTELSVIPLYEGMPPFYEVMRVLLEDGYEIRDMKPVARTPSGGVIEYDCLLTKA